MYHCKECGKPAVVNEDGVIRSCECDSVVIAECSATLQGEGGIKS